MTCVIPSQSYILSLFLMPVVQCIVAQWRHISSESAVSNMLQNTVKYVPTIVICNICMQIIAKCDAQPIAWDILLILTSVAGKLCNKCPKRLLEQNSSYSDYFNAISGLYRTAEPQEALSTIRGGRG